jgi:hypothetical protein
MAQLISSFCFTKKKYSIKLVVLYFQGERFDKMEKADILEMTVKCVRQLQKQQTNTGIDIISQCNKCNC